MEVAAGGGGGPIDVSPAALESAAASMAAMAERVESAGSGLVAALAGVDGSLGDPAAAAALAELVAAWLVPLGGLGPLVLRTSQATLQSSAAYAHANTAVQHAVG